MSEAEVHEFTLGNFDMSARQTQCLIVTSYAFELLEKSGFERH